jgi:4-hydroxy-tetrahydrodipicolinate synthase
VTQSRENLTLRRASARPAMHHGSAAKEGITSMASVAWSGVFPAVTTQFHADLSVDLPATQREIDALIADGIDGLIMLGTCGENNSLTAEEKRRVLQAAKEAAAGRVPVLSGVSEFTTAAAVDHARAAEKIGIDGLMLLPAMVYAPLDAELEQHFRTVLGASGLPVMAYNNPPAYRAELSLETLQRLADCPTLVAIKEAATDTRRYTDIINATGDRYVLFAGLDDMALEGLMLGATGWVSGFSNVFPAESRAIYTLARAGRYTEALPLYRWFMPVLHMDGWHTLVQCIKLSEAMVGRGVERVRPPRYNLAGAERARVEAIMRTALETRPDLASVA